MIDNNVIISFTSYPPRFKYCCKVIDSILNNIIRPYKICLTVYKNDIEFIPKDLQQYIDNNIIELIEADLDLKCHKKYFYVMQKYRDNPIITIDDDCYHLPDLIMSLLRVNYNCVRARRVHRKTYDENHKVNIFSKWEHDVKDTIPSFDLFAEGVGGVYYPANILNISDDMIPEIMQCLYNDDIYLNYLEVKNNIPVVYVPNSRSHPFWIDDSQKTGLWLTRNKQDNEDNDTNKAINLFLNNIKKI